MADTLLHIGIDELIPDPTQPRKTFLKEDVERMAASLLARGFLQPLRVLRDDQRQAWRIVVGETRWRGARVAGMTHCPCIVVEGQPSEADLLADRLVENSARNALRPLELARGIATLKRWRRCNSQGVAAELGISGASVSRAESLLTLPEDVQQLVDDGQLSESSAYEVSKLPDHESMRTLANDIVIGRLNRDQVIELVRLRVPKKNVQPKAGRVAGKVEGVSFTFSFASGELTATMLLATLDKIRAKLKDVQKSDQDVSALADLLRAS